MESKFRPTRPVTVGTKSIYCRSCKRRHRIRYTYFRLAISDCSVRCPKQRYRWKVQLVRPKTN
jgi:hypothetical protein